MNLNSHLNELQRKHETLSKQVEQAQRSLGADPLEIGTLKKQKLHLKEQISRLEDA